MYFVLNLCISTKHTLVCDRMILFNEHVGFQLASLEREIDFIEIYMATEIYVI